MKTYEIKNPSDALTIQADDFLIAAVAVALLGNGQYGIEGTPLLFGWDEWLPQQGIDDLGQYLEDHAVELATALRNVYLGTVEDRPQLDAHISSAKLANAELEAWRVERNNRLRTSMNDIEGQSRRLAAKLEEIAAQNAKENAKEGDSNEDLG